MSLVGDRDVAGRLDYERLEVVASPRDASGDLVALLEPGAVLVAPMTAPAWTPLFSRAVAVVTDVGSPAAHASIIARDRSSSNGQQR